MAGVLVAALVYTAVQLCLRSLLTTYLVKDVGFGLDTAGLALSVSQGGGMCGQIVWRWLSDASGVSVESRKRHGKVKKA